MSAQQGLPQAITMDDGYRSPLDRKVLEEVTRRNDRVAGPGFTTPQNIQQVSALAGQDR